jgi:hypothetical protein
MSDIKINKERWNELSNEAKKKIEDLINAAFKRKSNERYHIVPATSMQASSEDRSLACGLECQNGFNIAISECAKLKGEEAITCRLLAGVAFSDCISHCYGEGPH